MLRSSHFLTGLTKTTCETLPLMENNDFFRCNTVISFFFFFFGFSCSYSSTDLSVSGSRGNDLLPTRHWRQVYRFLDRIGQIGQMGRLAGWFGHLYNRHHFAHCKL